MRAQSRVAPIERVLVTGANGYLAPHVINALLDRGITVVAAARSAGAGAEHPLLTRIVADVLADDFAIDSIPGGAPDALLHLAWQDGFIHNAPTHLVALPKHLRLLESAVRAEVGRISVIGSMHEIGYWEGAIDATTPNRPLSLYGIAKNALRQAGEAVIAPSAQWQWLRCYYIVGDDRRNRSVFAKLLEAVGRGAETFPFTSGTAEYDFIDIDVLAHQIAVAVIAPDAEGTIECCSGVGVALGDRVQRFIDENELNIRLDLGAFPDRPYDSPGLWGDASRIRAILAEDAAR